MEKDSSNESKIWRIVLDVLKPHDPTLTEFAKMLGNITGVKRVDVDLFEIDKETETLKVTIDGNLDYPKIRKKIEEWGGVVHSVDEVLAGKRKLDELS